MQRDHSASINSSGREMVLWTNEWRAWAVSYSRRGSLIEVPDWWVFYWRRGPEEEEARIAQVEIVAACGEEVGWYDDDPSAPSMIPLYPRARDAGEGDIRLARSSSTRARSDRDGTNRAARLDR